MQMWMGSMPGTYVLNFDSGGRHAYGSPEHFFHFMLGYLLPGLREVIRLDSERGSREERPKFRMRSCGPLMDRLTKDIFSLHDYHCEVLGERDPEKDGLGIQIRVPRWDIWLIQSNRGEREVRFGERLRSLFTRNRFRYRRSEVLSSIRTVCARTIEKIDSGPSLAGLESYVDNYLILKRSHQPTYYDRGGKAEIPGYGTGRRELIGIDEVVGEMRKRDVPVQSFEPGNHSLAEQVKVFQCCRGIVAIKGAEFANLVWMSPGSKVVLIRPRDMRTPPVQMLLSQLLGLDYFEMESDEGMRPTLHASTISGIIER